MAHGDGGPGRAIGGPREAHRRVAGRPGRPRDADKIGAPGPLRLLFPPCQGGRQGGPPNASATPGRPRNPPPPPLGRGGRTRAFASSPGHNPPGTPPKFGARRKNPTHFGPSLRCYRGKGRSTSDRPPPAPSRRTRRGRTDEHEPD